jgi:hypothetical protein
MPAVSRHLPSGALVSAVSGGRPTGTVHAKITFAPCGDVHEVVLESGPFAGTLVGACIIGKLRAVRVPPFSGGSITVGRSFTID